VRNASQPFCPGVLGPIGIPATVSIEEMFDRARVLGAAKTSMLQDAESPFAREHANRGTTVHSADFDLLKEQLRRLPTAAD
jgi:hypothetical protein